MTSFEVEEVTVGDVGFVCELYESMMVRRCLVFLPFLFVTGRVFVIFPTDDNVLGNERLSFFDEKVEELLVIEVGLRIGEEDVLVLNTETVVVDAGHGGERSDSRGGHNVTPPHMEGRRDRIYIKAERLSDR